MTEYGMQFGAKDHVRPQEKGVTVKPCAARLCSRISPGRSLTRAPRAHRRRPALTTTGTYGLQKPIEPVKVARQARARRDIERSLKWPVGSC